MSRYTYRDRQKSLATRRRNARLRRQNNTAFVDLTEGLVVTKGVEKRLAKKATSGTLSALVVIWVLTFFFISRFPISEWSLLGLLPALVLTIFLVRTWRARVIELGEERKKRLDETRQFYSSPEWNLLRDQVIREADHLCSECGELIQYKEDITVDHIRPRSKYPDLALERQNLRVLCRSCNSRKGAKDWLNE